MKILIKGARVVDPLHGIDTVQDVLVNGNRVVQVGMNLTADNAEVIMAEGKVDRKSVV